LCARTQKFDVVRVLFSDKAIDLIDEAASKIRLEINSKPGRSLRNRKVMDVFPCTQIVFSNNNVFLNRVYYVIKRSVRGYDIARNDVPSLGKINILSTE